MADSEQHTEFRDYWACGCPKSAAVDREHLRALHAAAPEMLEALRAVVEETVFYRMGDPDGELPTVIWDMARAALAKAAP